MFKGFEDFQLKGVMGDSYSVGIDKINSTVRQSKFTRDSITVFLNIGGEWEQEFGTELKTQNWYAFFVRDRWKFWRKALVDISN